MPSGLSVASRCVLGLVLCAPVALRADEAPVVVPGARVRLSYGARTVVGRLESLDGRLLVVTTRKNDVPVRVVVPTDAIARLEVSISSRRHSARRGAASGLLGGALVGLAAGQDCGGRSNRIDDWCFDRRGTALAGAVVGASLGALIGLAFPGHAWREVRLEIVRPAVAPYW
jgi:hypothetical protein